MLVIAGGIVLGVIGLGVLRVIVDSGMAPSEGKPPRVPRIDAALRDRLAAGPCYVDRKGRVQQGLRPWRW